jgi:hypothetical protein
LPNKHDPIDLRRELLSNRRLNFFGLMAYDDVHFSWLEGECSPTDMRDQRSAVELVQDLCAIRFHARAQAGSHDDDVKWLSLTYS